MPAPDFGDDLRRYLGNDPLPKLAECMFSERHFAPHGVTSATDVHNLLRHTIAGQRWQHRRDDFHAFVAAVVACASPHSTALVVAFRYSAALYSTELGP